ncbi:MAG: hypothetical protein JWP69_1014 [Flaviaesturariibacter sp.]|nr:hypothetical protein [Flaviaesturariibacter sp.]
MTEKLLHFIWSFGYFNQSHLTTIDGQAVHIITKGVLNKNAGPDFQAAKIRIGDVLLAGSVELHLKTTDWQKHKHEDDPNYKNVILHVVYEHDQTLAHSIPVLELQPLISSLLLQRYEQLLYNSEAIACGKEIVSVKELTWLAWKERLIAERLTCKSDSIFSFLKETNDHWEEAFWWLLARNFGMKVNADAFEAIARSIPINVLAKQKSSIHQIEALLFGQAGLLTASFEEEYARLLQREYSFLKQKYNLKPTFAAIQFLRMRPGNFPTLRLAQLAMLIHTSQHLFSKILEAKRLVEVEAWLNVTANDYWHYHYRFDEEGSFKPKRLGAEMLKNIIINTVVPTLFAYGIYQKNETLKAKALHWLEELKPENNAITQSFQQLQVANASAFDSQALIQLRNEYCHQKRCLECAVGLAILKRAPVLI